MSEPIIEDAADAALTPVANRSVRARESALLIALAVVGAIAEYPLALAMKSVDRAELGHMLPFMGVTLVLASLVPLSLRLTKQLGLPGAPLIEAKLAGEKLTLSIASLIRTAVGYAMLSAVVGAIVLAIVLVPIFLMHPKGGGDALPTPPMLSVAPGKIAVVGALIALVAAISEEIQFRLVLYAILGWVARLMSRDPDGHPGRKALWVVTIVQGYAFGMIHLIPVAGPLFHSTFALLAGGLLMPQTWEGVVFGRLYLRRGLEASMIAHATMDVALFALAAIGMLGTHLGGK